MDWVSLTRTTSVSWGTINTEDLPKYPLTMVITNNSQHWRDIFFVKNVIESDCDYSWSSYIATTNGASITNIVIADNTMVPYRQSTNRTVALNIQGIGATQRQMAGIRIFRNVWPTNTEHSLWFYPP